MFPIHNLRPAMAVVQNGSVNIGKDTIDVMIKGCFVNFDTVACVRKGVMSFLVVMTMICCVVKIAQLHLRQHQRLHQFIIFYTAVVECLLLLIHWLVEGHVQLDFAASYLKLIQFLVVSHFYWTFANRAQRKEALTNRVIVPVYSVAFVYFTLIVALGCIFVEVSWIECFQPYWLMLSATEFALVQLFVLAGFYITRRLNQIMGLELLRTEQICNLWSVIIAFEVSALVAAAYDVALQILGDEENGCSGVFHHLQMIYSSVFGTFMVIKFLLPIWAMLFAFRPNEVTPASPELLPPRSADGSYTSVFTSTDGRSQYRPLCNPTAEEGAFNSPAARSPPCASSSYTVNADLPAAGSAPRSSPSPDQQATSPSEEPSPVQGPVSSGTAHLSTIGEDSDEIPTSQFVDSDDQIAIIS